ncbi:AAA family ATPase [Thalassoglobus polymorphus]|uniref:ATPase RavA n=1 Tax=Thalassoglobus polymorphus TaxID=2527994 RepID=A0A517QM06_9PLAN|nr:MoxR family ATPase [Thalassoglobus polymorphus]QDT32587.1 ATPase RavA [Thalassoglobus polymorphus]
MSTDVASLIGSLEENIAKVLLGKDEVIRLCVVALLAEGHLLIEDSPGVGKTSLAKAIAQSLNCQFSRLQCTPDMLPSDILGSSIFLPNQGTFEFRKGPIFTNVLLSDEINRTTPRTQSALLEAMMERQISVDGQTYQLDKPFLVIATQNPFEFEGTYPLPENQLDRFMLCTTVGYPDRDAERLVFNSHRTGEPVDDLQAVMTDEQVIGLQQKVRKVTVEESVADYILDLVQATRENKELSLGVSTRGALTMYRAAQSLALVEGRNYVIPDDVKRLASPVLAHRVVCRGVIREGQRNRARQILQQIVDTTPVPS